MNKHFSDKEVSTVFYDTDDKEYEVRFSDGSKIEFDKKGSWEEIEDRDNVPATVMPQPIRDYLATNHKNTKVRKISADRRGYEVELLGDMELKFNKKGKFLRYDD
ncbi:MAG: PepSY-like domain-containing protein [Bacteroidales bacterium]|nr:PepSY-like domain-containing protein [Bacteroidales bacterium]